MPAAQTPQPRGIRVVRESFWHQVNGYPEMIKKGTTVRASHPLVKKYEDYFQPPGYVDIEDK